MIMRNGSEFAVLGVRLAVRPYSILSAKIETVYAADATASQSTIELSFGAKGS